MTEPDHYRSDAVMLIKQFLDETGMIYTDRLAVLCTTMAHEIARVYRAGGSVAAQNAIAACCHTVDVETSYIISAMIQDDQKN